jgi:hypothetical protein
VRARLRALEQRSLVTAVIGLVGRTRASPWIVLLCATVHDDALPSARCSGA